MSKDCRLCCDDGACHRTNVRRGTWHLSLALVFLLSTSMPRGVAAASCSNGCAIGIGCGCGAFVVGIFFAVWFKRYLRRQELKAAAVKRAADEERRKARGGGDGAAGGNAPYGDAHDDDANEAPLPSPIAKEEEAAVEVHEATTTTSGGGKSKGRRSLLRRFSMSLNLLVRSNNDDTAARSGGDGDLSVSRGEMPSVVGGGSGNPYGGRGTIAADGEEDTAMELRAAVSLDGDRGDRGVRPLLPRLTFRRQPPCDGPMALREEAKQYPEAATSDDAAGQTQIRSRRSTEPFEHVQEETSPSPRPSDATLSTAIRISMEPAPLVRRTGTAKSFSRSREGTTQNEGSSQ